MTHYCFKICCAALEPINTTESSPVENSSNEPSAKKSKLGVPVAETFEVPDSLRNGKDFVYSKQEA